MGNCQCVVINASFPEQQNSLTFKKQTNLNFKGFNIQQENTALLQFSSMSSKTMKTKSIASQNNQKGSISNQLVLTSSNQNKQNCFNQKISSTEGKDQNASKWQVSIVDKKITLKQFYQLKKMVQKVQNILIELDIHKLCINHSGQIKDLKRQDFTKINIISHQQQLICYYRGILQKENGLFEMQGEGELYFANGSYFNGSIVKNQFEGEGLYLHQNNDYYYGSWRKNQAFGYGTYAHYESVIYKGDWEYDLQHGQGEQYWPDGAHFVGIFQKGKKKRGKFEWPNHTSYQGEFKDNRFDGKGAFIWQDSRNYVGQWSNNMMCGFGTFTWANGQTYQGYYEKDKKNGKGKLRLVDGTIIKGKWVLGKIHGNSIVIRNNIKTIVKWEYGIECPLAQNQVV